MSIAENSTDASINLDNIPAELKGKQSVLWKTVTRKGMPTKVPFQVNGQEAKSNDPKTWASFDAVWQRYQKGGYDGVGFVFSYYDPYAGIDLDGCRDPETGKIDEWAMEVIQKLDTYTEVSPSGSGFKCFVKGNLPFDAGTGKKKNLDYPPKGGKDSAGIEVYDKGRYFTLTGRRLDGFPDTPQERDLYWIREKFWPELNRVNKPAPRQTSGPQSDVIKRARSYITTMPPAISGSGGHNQTFAVACVLVIGFGLEEDDALMLLREYNDRCEPPWSEKELQHKIKSAGQQPGERGYLLNARPQTPKAKDVDLSMLLANLGVETSQHEETDLTISQAEVEANRHKPLQYNRITCAELDASSYDLEYLIENVLVARQPCIVAGGKKCLKTSLILDMGIALAMGGCFLGKLSVNRACRTAIMTGESGLATIQETCRRICDAAGYRLADIGNLIFSEDLPRFGIRIEP
ncbi:MAG: AAA family ATPase [Pirellulales bacterium]|nr:AAA family ATPase [Pirellulales bacterium]